MSIPENSNPKPTAPGPNSEFRRVPLSQIRPSRKNPRKIIRQEMIDARAASMAEEGQTNAIIIRPLTPAELLNDGVLYEIVDGELRYRAAQKNGDKDIDAKIEDISPLKAFKVGVSSNRTNKPGWFEDYLAMEEIKKNEPDTQNQEIAALFETDPTNVSRAIRILDVLNEPGRALVLENLQNSTGNRQIAENTLYTLTDLGDPQTVEKALKVAIDGKLTQPKAQGLVEWVQAGNPPETFTGHKAPKTPKPKPTPGLPPEAIDQLVELSRQWGLAEGRGEDPTPAQDKLKAFRESLTVAAPSAPTPQTFKVVSPEGFALLKQKIGDTVNKVFKPSPKAEHALEKEAFKKLKWFEKLAHWFLKYIWRLIIKNEHKFCKKLAHAMVPLRSSHSGGSHHRSGSFSQGAGTLVLTILHWAVYSLLQFVFLWAVAMWFTSHWLTGLKPWVETPFRLAARLALVDFPDWLIPYALRYWPLAIVAGLLFFWGYSYAWKTQPTRMTLLGLGLFLFVYYGRHWSEATTPEPQNQQAQVQAAAAPEAKPKESLLSKIISHPKPARPMAAPVQVYQPAVSFIPSPASTKTLYDPKLLELEIAAVPKNSIIKDYVYQPDEGMPADLAVSRLQDLTDADKYTMMIGSGKQKILSFTPSNTNFILAYQSTDPLSIFGGGGPQQMNFFWEDVLYVHANEIDLADKARSVMYQCSLVVKDTKNPLTIQCASADDLENLVSTLEYFVRHSRLGRDAQPGGMPYPDQGMKFGGDCMVTLLWADSPAGRAGVDVGGRLWSLDKNTDGPQDWKKIEAGLRSLPAVLFVVDAAEWRKRLDGPIGFKPKRRKVVLVAS